MAGEGRPPTTFLMSAAESWVAGPSPAMTHGQSDGSLFSSPGITLLFGALARQGPSQHQRKVVGNAGEHLWQGQSPGRSSAEKERAAAIGGPATLSETYGLRDGARDGPTSAACACRFGCAR